MNAETSVTSTNSKTRKRKTPHNSRASAVERNICNKMFTQESSLADHSGESAARRNRRNMLCPLCDTQCLKIKQIEEHLVDVHSSQITIERRQFKSFEEFKSWKQKEEAETKTRYNTRSSGSRYNYNVYLCHRSGFHRKQGRQIKLRRTPTEKLNRCCPARIVTKEINKTIKVVFHKTHIGHDLVKSNQMTEEHKNKYEEMLKNKVKIDKIFKEVKSDVQTDTEVRLRTVLKRDEKYLKGVKPFAALISEKGELSEWIIQQKGSLENCVLCYKTDTESCFHCFSLFAQGTDVMDLADTEEFVLILMTKRQRDEISKFNPKNVVLDSSRGEHGSYGVASLILVDEFSTACPIAFCIASNINAKTIAHFFLTLKEAVGEISANVFMSCDISGYYDSWIQFMGNVKNRLLCSWDVERMWQSKLEKVIESREITNIEVYHGCLALLERKSCSDFKVYLNNLIDLSMSYQETRDFGKYFKEKFAGRPEQWALCFRSDFTFKNFKLELLHRRLQYCQRASGVINRKIECCVNKLLQVGDEMILARFVRQAKRPIKIGAAILSIHEKASAITESMIKTIRENVWSVEYGTRAETVSFTPEIHCKCQQMCDICTQCFHQISCTCSAYLFRNEFCEHAHACMIWEKKKKEAKVDFNDTKKKKLDELNNILESISSSSQRLNDKERCKVYEQVNELYLFAKSLIEESASNHSTSIPIQK